MIPSQEDSSAVAKEELNYSKNFVFCICKNETNHRLYNSIGTIADLYFIDDYYMEDNMTLEKQKSILDTRKIY